jgi:hypothetical protein
MAKAKKAAEKAETKGAAPPVGPPPEAAPLPQKLVTYQAVPDEVLMGCVRPLSLDQVRMHLDSKVKWLQSVQQDCPGALFSDIENVIVHLQVSLIGEVVKNYVRLMETTRFWWVHCQEQGRVVERQRKLYQRQLDQKIRSTWPADGPKMTNDAVDAVVRSDTGHEQWLVIQEAWEFLALQLNQIIMSMQTEMLVQSSVWSQYELGMRDKQVPSGAVG